MSLRLTERRISIPAVSDHLNMIAQIQNSISLHLDDGIIPVRFAITSMDENNYQCEFGMLSGVDAPTANRLESIFRFQLKSKDRF